MTEIQGTFSLDDEGNLVVDENWSEKILAEVQAAEKQARERVKKSQETVMKVKANRYYNAVDKLFKDVASYLEALGLKELVEEVDYREWGIKARHIMEVYYRNDYCLLSSAAENKLKTCMNDITIINAVCRSANIEQVKSAEKLVDRLADPHRRQCYRRYIKSRKKRGVIISMDELEKVYRKNNPKRFMKSA